MYKVHDDSIMSYLIALYVYYHGNNLPVFGIIKGEKAEDIKNEGMKRPEEIDTSLVDPALVESVKKQEIQKSMPSFEELMRKAMAESLKDTYKLQQAGEIENTIFDSTPDIVIDQYEDSGEIDLDFFDTLNGF